MSSLSPSPKFRGVDTTTGLALVGGKLNTYAAGTSTPKVTYTSSTLGTPNANPVVLDSRGEADVWLDGAYKFVLTDSLNNTIWTVDNITDPTNGATFTNATFAGTTSLVNLTVSGTTALGDAVADTLSVSGSVIKNGTGNWTIPAPSSGVPVTINAGAAGVSTLAFAGAPATGFKVFGATGSTTAHLFSDFSNTSGSFRFGVESSVGGIIAGGSSAYSSMVGSGTATDFHVVTNLVVRTTWSSGGNVTIAAPASGVGLTGTGVAGSDAFVYNGGTSGSFRVNTTGVPYGTSLHNNAGAVTGTTNQYICSGTYTPTLTGVVNVAASTAFQLQWMRVGNVVTVAGRVDIDPTAASVATSLGISLPIASAFAGSEAGGAANRQATIPPLAGTILADTTNDRLSLDFTNDTDVVSRAWVFSATYLIV